MQGNLGQVVKNARNLGPSLGFVMGTIAKAVRALFGRTLLSLISILYSPAVLLDREVTSFGLDKPVNIYYHNIPGPSSSTSMSMHCSWLNCELSRSQVLLQRRKQRYVAEYCA